MGGSLENWPHLTEQSWDVGESRCRRHRPMLQSRMIWSGVAASSSATPTASSCSPTPGSEALKHDPTHVAHGRGKRQNNQPLSVKRDVEVSESHGEVKKVAGIGL